jgi:hypothetical protein
MSSSFTMTLSNQTNHVMSNIQLVHICNNDVSALLLDSLDPYSAGPSGIPCTTYDGHNDYYLLQFTWAAPGGSAVYQANCYCNSTSDSTKVNIANYGDYYNVEYDDGTSCPNKSYYSTT